MSNAGSGRQAVTEACAAARGRTVLAVFWAPWHVRAKEMLEEARRLADSDPTAPLVVPIDVDCDMDFAIEQGMRAVPLCILLRNGVETDRSGCTSGLAHWLWRHDLALASRPADFDGGKVQSPSGAFRGDAKLQARLRAELKEKARAGAIYGARAPRWCHGRGTITGALAGSLIPAQAEAVSGLPFSFVCVLEFLCCDWSPALVDEIFDAIEPGAELGGIALRLMYQALSDPHVDWAGQLDDPALDAWRVRWLRLAERQLAGIPVEMQEWSEILVGCGSLRSAQRDPWRAVQDCVIDLLGLLSPPPASDEDLWVNIFSMHGLQLMHSIRAYESGWTREDFAFEGIRARWFMDLERRQPGGRFTPEALEEARQEWVESASHGGQARFDRLLEEASAQFPLFERRIREQLLALLAETRYRRSA
ncbi:MAG: hypothetical protein BSR46_02135 [Candidatus Dactylopiibacterium carminicum]|uniref:thioredoxin family protein n=1 Tax=Candidatus Dactylopiibacterium carminicum TaxID=857335 RepID=UPI000BDC1B04|nr:thioredoxin family protein [Candidatus Dactylopiibacterium carminicum]PAT00520.1 MAG: hypothetical protein BSR46_02135 [Candidatus Dactylopiibacterium carminicum]